jgi:hypothetical protein
MLYALVGDEPLRRLGGVAGCLIPRIYNEFEDDPVLKGKLLEIAERLTSVETGPGDYDNIDATVNWLSDQEAKEIAHNIVSVAFEEIERLAERTR